MLDYNADWMEATLEDLVEFARANGLPTSARAIETALTRARQEMFAHANLEDRLFDTLEKRIA
ncbi:hypothetical protein [Roseivivax sp. CAU 1761]